jgi:hypothetical protein
MTATGASAMWIRRTVLAALPALLARPEPAQARPVERPAPTSTPVVLMLGAEAAAWTPALLEAGCAPLGPLDPADLADAVTFARQAPGAPAIALLGPAALVDAQAGLEGINLMVRLGEAPAPLSLRTALAALAALLNDDPLSKAHAVMLAAQDGEAPSKSARRVLSLASEGDLPLLAPVLADLAVRRA